MISVSVVVPVYNGRQFIRRALRSAVEQTLRPMEIIVIDDGSTDETRKELESYAVRYQRQEHQGAGAARNLGVSLARGEWVAFLDADDVWHPDKLEIQWRHMENYPEVEFVYSDVDLVDDSGKVLRKHWASAEFVQKKPNSRQQLSRRVFDGRPFPLPSTVMLKHKLIERSGGFSSAFKGKYHEDFEFFARLAQLVSPHFIPQSLAQHRRHNIHTAADAEMDRQNWLTFLNCLWQLWQSSPSKQASLTRHFAKYYANEGKRALRTGNYLEARRLCRLAHSYWPFATANIRHWILSYLPGLRELYRRRAAKRGSKQPRACGA